MSTDLDLIARFRDTRSREDFDALVARHGPMVHRVGMRVLRDRHDADDVVQLTFIQLLQHPNSAYPQVTGWLHRVAKNTAKNLRQSRASRTRREATKVRMMVADQLSDEECGELREEIDTALDRLPGLLREAMILHHLEGRSHEECARISGCTEEAIRKRAQRGLRQLRAILEDRGAICGLAALTAFFAAESAASAAVSATVVFEFDLAGAAVTEGPSAAVTAQATSQGPLVIKFVATVAMILAAATLGFGLYSGMIRGMGVDRARNVAGGPWRRPIAGQGPASLPRFHELELGKVATASSSRPIFRPLDGRNDVLILPAWGELKVHGIPFHVDDPHDGAVRNVIVLFSTVGDFRRRAPMIVGLPCGRPATAVHLLSGVSGWGYPRDKAKTVAIIVRIRYADGDIEDHPLLNGVHFADYSQRVDVPGSELAFRMKGGYQMRHLAIKPGRTEPIERIEFLKGDDRTAPVVMAVTVETRG